MKRTPNWWRHPPNPLVHARPAGSRMTVRWNASLSDAGPSMVFDAAWIVLLFFLAQAAFERL